MVIPWRQKVTSRSCVPNVHRCQRGVKWANGEGLGVSFIEDLLVEGWDVRVLLKGQDFFRLMNDSGMNETKSHDEWDRHHGFSEEVSMGEKKAARSSNILSHNLDPQTYDIGVC